MLEPIFAACLEALTLSGVTIDEAHDTGVDVAIGHDGYTVTVDEFELDEDEELTGSKWEPNTLAPHAHSPKNHGDLLDVCLAGLARAPFADQITDMTTDGDNHDCEAIFAINGEFYVVKVRG